MKRQQTIISRNSNAITSEEGKVKIMQSILEKSNGFRSEDENQ